MVVVVQHDDERGSVHVFSLVSEERAMSSTSCISWEEEEDEEEEEQDDDDDDSSCCRTACSLEFDDVKVVVEERVDAITLLLVVIFGLIVHMGVGDGKSRENSQSLLLLSTSTSIPSIPPTLTAT